MSLKEENYAAENSETKEERLKTIPKDIKSKTGPLGYKMQLSKEEIESMISNGSLEKLSDGSYRAKVSTINNMKSQGKNIVSTANAASIKAIDDQDVSVSDGLIPLLPLEVDQESSNTSEMVEVHQPSTSAGPSKILTRSGFALYNQLTLKRKAQLEDTLPKTNKKPYKYAKTARKIKRSQPKNSVSDYNSSEEETDERTESRALSIQLASTFFKNVGETKKYSKSLLDKLHQAIFQENVSESESDEEMSDVEQEINDIINDTTSCQLANCPGPGKIETHVGPGKNSKLTIVQSHETKMIKNFLYEVYKVRVTSAGREANTNILIPIPEGYKFQYPTRASEESVEFSHLPHKDAISASSVHPKFLEELASSKLKLRKYKDEIKVLRGRYLELLQEYANRPQFSTLSDLVGASAKFLTEDQLIFYLMQLKSGAHNMQGIRYSVREKVLALSIYQKSPEMYKWFRKMFNLPSKRTLDQWLEELGNHNPVLLKKLMYHVYISYNYKPLS